MTYRSVKTRPILTIVWVEDTTALKTMVLRNEENIEKKTCNMDAGVKMNLEEGVAMTQEMV